MTYEFVGEGGELWCQKEDKIVAIDLWQEMEEHRIELQWRYANWIERGVVGDPVIWWAQIRTNDREILYTNYNAYHPHDSPYDAVLELLVQIGEKDDQRKNNRQP